MARETAPRPEQTPGRQPDTDRKVQPSSPREPKPSAPLRNPENRELQANANAPKRKKDTISDPQRIDRETYRQKERRDSRTSVSVERPLDRPRSFGSRS